MPDRKFATPLTNFTLTLDGLESVSMFREFSGFSSSFSPVTDTWESDASRPEHAKFPQGVPEWEPISVVRSLDSKMDLWKWFEECHINGNWQDQKKEGTLTLLDHKLKPIMKFKIVDAWPSSYGISDLDYENPNTPATEEMQIIHAGLQRIQ
jgi:phage tail-like protein